MKTILSILTAILFLSTSISCAQKSNYNNNDFAIKNVNVTQHSDLGITVWEISVNGTAGKTVPIKNGQLDGAPVLGYVFPTSLKPTDVGFNQTDGIVALALTSHPDFDDTPLWDENNDQIYNNDGVIWHPHWVILHQDKRVVGGLSVKQFKKADKTVVLPPTNPGMPMYMDSPGYPVTTKGNTIKVVVPNYRMNNQTDFNYDGVTAFMKVNTSNKNLPMLGVYEVFSVASGNLSLPYKVKK
ncbi:MULTISPECIES: hypothetical protein [unclassified Tenacibaculum]|uniref:hypothetical protein n=1 Tax=unclassified Tenacibaculum TaxID=2635139 RepID=UPI001F19044B|nr:MULTISPECIES: hypothetical protein [unclassified Tenacibaculum]MCF2876474.1 hypothetical protein [Tenacibaculum sp. Cn5-1]MCF2936619.1 hypothetical protein [Tenacibaculum sp. Cn5-34]MCG7511788.1 hypothetical protein [Tenacibaculum sp. Cn5-46]